MGKLIRIELNKIFKHKSIYIVLFIIIAFCFLNNILYRNDYDNDGFYKYEKVENLDKYIKRFSFKNKKLNINKDSDKILYVTNKTKIDVAKIKKKYKYRDWRYIKANDYLYDNIYNCNYHKYISNDENELILCKKDFEKKYKKFKINNWVYFLKKEKKSLYDREKNVNDEIKNTSDLKLKETLNEEKDNIDIDLKIINYRLKKKISYGDNYLNRSLLEYRQNINVENNRGNLSKIDYYNKLSSYYVNKYIIDNKTNVNKVNTLNYQLRNIVDDYELFIVLIILITVSIIIGEEFNKGTIKLLLIKPFSRSKILLSKYISCFIMILLTIMFVFVINFFVGSLFFGIDSLKNGVVVYSFNLHKVLKINIFLYVLMRVVAKIPMFIIIETLGILLGIVLTNTISSFSITMLLYTFSEVINKIAINYKLKFMKYFITLNWNFRDYLFGGFTEYPYVNLKNSMLIFIIYVIIFMGVMFKAFERKDIKNI